MTSATIILYVYAIFVNLICITAFRITIFSGVLIPPVHFTGKKIKAIKMYQFRMLCNTSEYDYDLEQTTFLNKQATLQARPTSFSVNITL